MFVQVEWTLELDSIKFVVKECDVAENEKKVNIIQETCYSQTIGAQPVGDAAQENSNAKAVDKKS